MEQDKTYINSLTELGLSTDQIAVYGALLSGGMMLGRMVVAKSGLKKGLTYKVLDQLIDMGLVEKKDRGNQAALFFPAHPRELQKFVDQKREKVQHTQEILDAAMGNMVSQYNLLAGKPNVQFFEGKDGVQKVLDDTLRSNGEVLTYLDIEVVEKHFKDINDKYVAKREKKDVKKRILVIDSEFARSHFTKRCTEDSDFSSVTDLKMVKTPVMDIEGAVQIYDGKVGLITVSNQNLISVIIEDQRIYKLFQSMFEAIYIASTDFTC